VHRSLVWKCSICFRWCIYEKNDETSSSVNKAEKKTSKSLKMERAYLGLTPLIEMERVSLRQLCPFSLFSFLFFFFIFFWKNWPERLV